MNQTKQMTAKANCKLADRPKFIQINNKCYLTDYLIIVRGETDEKPVCRNCGAACTRNGFYLKVYYGVLPEPLETQWQATEKRINSEQNCGENRIGGYETAFWLQRWSCPVCRKSGEKQLVMIDYPDFLLRYYQQTETAFIEEMKEELDEYNNIMEENCQSEAENGARKRSLYTVYVVDGKRRLEPGEGVLSYRLLCYLQCCQRGIISSPVDYFLWLLQSQHNKMG